MADGIWWPAICGNTSDNDALWLDRLTLNTTSPDLTTCFQNTVLVWLPCLLFWACCAAYTPFLASRPPANRLRDTSWFNVTKTATAGLLCLVMVSDLIKQIIVPAQEGTTPAANYIKPAVYFVSMLLATSLTHYEFRKGVHSGPLLFGYWLSLAVTGIVPFRSHILRMNSAVKEDLYDVVTFFVFYAIVLLQAFMTCFADKQALPWWRHSAPEKTPLLRQNGNSEFADRNKVCPEMTSPFWIRMLFMWITKLMISGYRRPLVFDDMWLQMDQNKTEPLVNRFTEAWDKEVKASKYRMTGEKRPDLKQHAANGFAPCNGRPAGGDVTHKAKRMPSVWKALYHSFAGYFSLGIALRLVFDALTFAQPQILGLLLTFISAREVFEWQGYFLVVLMFVVSCMRTVFIHHYWHVGYVTGMRLRTAITGAVYRKALRLSSASRQKTAVGEIVNLMSVDAQKLQDAFVFIHMLWASPLTIVVALYFLWQQLGPSVLAGFALMILFVPLNSYVAKKLRNLQVSQMNWKDARINLINEVLSGIKVLKFYAWEDSFRSQILGLREKELDALKKGAYLTATNISSWYMSPYLVALGSFATFVLSSPDNVLDPKKAFVSLALFNVMNISVSMLPITITFAVQISVAVDRIQRFLLSEELDETSVTHDPTVAAAVRIDNASFTWDCQLAPVLRNVNLEVASGSLVAVVGHVGAGKSSFISALLGELEVQRGTVTMKGSVAYVPQQACIMNATLKENILFGQSFVKNRYDDIINACALRPDLKVLSGGDETEIGEKGINISGGQKQRISMARSIYQDTDLYLLDDPLSAVDAHVGRHIFDHVIGPSGLLKTKTRILVTNSVMCLPSADLIVVLVDGQVSEMGTFQELLDRKAAFAAFIAKHGSEQNVSSGTNDALDVLRTSFSSGHFSEDSETHVTASGNHVISDSRVRRRRLLSVEDEVNTNDVDVGLHRLVQEEEIQTGAVKLSVLISYLKASGYVFWPGMIFWFFLYLGAQVFTNIWLSAWSNDPVPANSSVVDTTQRDLRLGVYGGLGILQLIGTLGQSMALARGGVNASRFFHSKILAKILRAPMSFFDTTPFGRIVNRFSRDIDTLDVNIPLSTRLWVKHFTMTVASVFVISYSTPVFLVAVVPFGLLYYLVQRFYVTSSRQMKRIESIRRSPIYAHFSETLSGVSSIRAYRQQRRFIEKCDRLVDDNQRAYFIAIISNRWMGVLLEGIGSCMVLLASLFAVMQRSTITAGLAGLSVSYALQVTMSLNTMVRTSSDLENYIIAVERIDEYANLETEPSAGKPDSRLPDQWPAGGRVEFRDYSTRYRPGLPLILKNVSCTFEAREKVGIVGRTGAGKSSMTLALFRIIEASSGSIVIDGQVIGDLPLSELRARLTIIPQDPVLFTGTFRMNLDPFGKHSDAEVWRSLEHAHLREYVSSLPLGLQNGCAEGGQNMSVGQRQLVCLARALLRHTRVLVLDEATAAVDLETDALIQTTIRTAFADCTVITIAHRLNTIADYDRVLVLDNGRVKEFDSPAALMKNKDSQFYSMVKQAGF